MKIRGRHIGAAAVAVALAVGAGSAFAAEKEALHANTSAAHFDGTVAFHGRQRPSRPGFYEARVMGNFRNTEDDGVYLQTHADGYGYVTNAGLDSKRSQKVDFFVGAGDVRVSRKVYLRVCESHWGPDECDETVAKR